VAKAFLISLLAVAFAGSAAASPFASDKKAQVDLVIDHMKAAPGDEVRIGVRFTMKPTWHIYWKNPGDAGTAPSFAWTLPEGVEASEPQFPVPVSFQGGGLTAYGYKETIIFPATLTVPANATPGSELTIELATDYLVCDPNVCIPESATARLTLPIAAEAEIDVEATNTLLAARGRLPMDQRAAREAGADILVAEPTRVIATLPEGATDVELFPLPPKNLEATPGDVVENPPGTNQYALPLRLRRLGNAQYRDFPAVVAWTTADGRRMGASITITGWMEGAR
jgi:thiol:disulfide interchange protein DsbD